MDNLKYLENLGWGTWSTPYSRDRVIKSLPALDIVNRVVELISYGRKVLPVERPKVVVVGAQGCGKSSILESMIGTGFLPKGPSPGDGEPAGVENKLRTTCPVVINLVKCAKVADCRHSFWVEFAHDKTTPKKCFVDLDEIEAEIGERMEFLASASPEDDVSEEELILSYFSSEVVNVTLVDLPGLVLNRVADAEASESESSIERLVMKYIGQPDNLILAVTPATLQLTPRPSPILDFIKKVDPNEKRTLAVLSHWDKLPTTWQGHKIVLGQSYFKMDLGVVGIRNRSGLEIMKKTSVQNAQVEAEHHTMNNYKELTSVLTGVGVGPRYLVERVCEMVIFLWVSRLRTKRGTMNMALDYMRHKIQKREELIAVGYQDDGGCLTRMIRHLKYVVAVIENDYEDFGIEGSATRHRELSERFRHP